MGSYIMVLVTYAETEHQKIKAREHICRRVDYHLEKDVEYFVKNIEECVNYGDSRQVLDLKTVKDYNLASATLEEFRDFCNGKFS